MDKTQKQLDEFFNNASAVQVEEGTWYYHESSVESELSKLYQELEQLLDENEELKAEIRILDRLLSKYMRYEYKPSKEEESDEY